MPTASRLVCVATIVAVTACACCGRPQHTVPAKPPRTAISVETVTIHKVAVPSEIRQTVQFAKVSGLRSQTTADRINKSLRESADNALGSFTRDLLQDRDDPVDGPVAPATTTVSSKAIIGLVNTKVVAVEYRYSADGGELGRVPGWSTDPLVLDTADGHRLTAKELLAPRVATAEGAREFSHVLAASGPGGRLCDTTPPDVRTVFRPDELTGDRNIVTIFPTTMGVSFGLGLWKLGFPMSCNGQLITIGYPKLKPFLGPSLIP